MSGSVSSCSAMGQNRVFANFHGSLDRNHDSQNSNRLLSVVKGVDTMVQLDTRERLYRELNDPKNYAIIIALAKVFPEGLSVSEFVRSVGSAWTEAGKKGGGWHAIQRRFKILEEQALVRRLADSTEHAKKVLYTLSSRTLFEYGVMEAFFDSSRNLAEGARRLTKGLERSFLFHKVPVDIEKLRSIASLTGEFVRLGYFDELRRGVFSERLRELPLHKTRTESVAVFFIRAFLRNRLYLEKFAQRVPMGLTEREIRHLFEDIKRQLWNERRNERELSQKSEMNAS